MQRYIDKSEKAGKWLESPQVCAWPRESVMASRRRYHEGGGGVFSDMRAAVVMSDERKRDVYR